jgi:Peptidase family C78
MPEWLRKQLEDDTKITVHTVRGLDEKPVEVFSCPNETSGLVPVLYQLLEQDKGVDHAYLCHPATQHVVKTAREGGFCGYRNIQMLISYIQGAQAPGYPYFEGRIPTILRLQDLIEEAWDQGINSAGRLETGGIKGTRKYIGTPEAQALFISLSVEYVFVCSIRTRSNHD